MGCHPSHWRNPSFFKMVGIPPTRVVCPYICFLCWKFSWKFHMWTPQILLDRQKTANPRSISASCLRLHRAARKRAPDRCTMPQEVYNKYTYTWIYIIYFNNITYIYIVVHIHIIMYIYIYMKWGMFEYRVIACKHVVTPNSHGQCWSPFSLLRLPFLDMFDFKRAHMYICIHVYTHVDAYIYSFNSWGLHSTLTSLLYVIEQLYILFLYRINMQETFSTRAVGTSPSGYMVSWPQIPKFKKFMVPWDIHKTTFPTGCLQRMIAPFWTIESVYKIGKRDPGTSRLTCISILIM